MSKRNKNLITSTMSLLLGVGLTVFILLLLSGWSVSKAAPGATTFYVNGSTGNDGFDCLSSGTACETISGAIAKASWGDTIHIAAGVYYENLDVQDLTLIGAGMDSTIIDGNQVSRVMTVTLGATLSNLSLRNGELRNITGDIFAKSGGGIKNSGDLLLQNVRVYSNTAESLGGGIFNAGTLILENSEVLSNTSDSSGGGIYNWYSGESLTVTNSLIAGNTAVNGGGISGALDIVIIDTTLRKNNTSSWGAAIDLGLFIKADLNRVAIYDNQANTYAAGIFNPGAVLTITNSTLSGNTAGTYTAIYNTSADAQTTILNSTIAYNYKTDGGPSAGGINTINNGVINIKNTIVANNDYRNCFSSDGWNSLGYNLSSDYKCFAFTQTGDQQNVDPKLSPLGDYGGTTWTHALMDGSPAIDGGDNTACPTVDQRSAARPVDGDSDGNAVCDIGAYEVSPQISISDTQVLEGDLGTTNAVFTVTLSPTSTLPVTVSYQTADFTALSPTEYTAESGVLVFSAGQSIQTITIDVNGDTDDEPDQIFYVNLSNPQGADLIDDQAVGTIIDNDGLPALTINDVSVDEGDFGNTTAIFNVNLSPASAQQVTVDYVNANLSALANIDYAATQGQLVFAPLETNQTINVTVYGDLIDEGVNETFLIQLSNATNASIIDSQGLGTIKDDEVALLSIAAGPTVVESPTPPPAVFTITLSTPYAYPVTVDYETDDGYQGAIAGSDYLARSGTATIPAGQTSVNVEVPIVGDIIIETEEIFYLRISNGNPLPVFTNGSIARILDDDDYIITFLPITVR